MTPQGHPGDMYYQDRMLDCKAMGGQDVCTPPHMASYYYPQHGMPDPSVSPNAYTAGMPNPACMSGMGSPNMPVYPWMRQNGAGESFPSLAENFMLSFIVFICVVLLLFIILL